MTTEFNGTPGNWEIGEPYLNKHGVKVLPINSDYGVDELASVYIPQFNHEDQPDYLANAKVIASAPNLLEAVKMVLSIPVHEWGSKHLEICQNALNKAIN